MKILMLNYEFPPIGGGAANANYYLLRKLRDKDIHVDLVTGSPAGFQKQRFSKHITIYKLDVQKDNYHYWTMREMATWTRKAYRYTKKLLSEGVYDVCHCWFGWPSGIIGYLFRKKMSYIVALRGSDVPGYNARLRYIDPILRPISKKVWKHAEEVTVLSHDLAHLAKQTLSRDYQLIYNGIDTEEFHPGESVKDIRILYVGRLIERKGLRYALEGVRKVQDLHQDKKIPFTIVGEGNQMEELKGLAEGMDITFKGRVAHKDLPEIYRQHNVLLLPSLEEALGNVTQEAMASGLAIITTKTGAAEVADALLVEKKNAQDIANKLQILINDPSLLHRIAENNVRKAKEMDWSVVADKYMEIYGRI